MVEVGELVERRVRHGANREESQALLAQLCESCSGDNLAHALVYHDFATEQQAYRFIENQSSA